MATRAKKTKPSTEVNGLLEALKFVSIAQHSKGTVLQTYCRISNGTVIAFDGAISAGQYIEESLNVCPHTETLILALSKCKEAVSITELETGRLSIKSGKFKALVPCVAVEDLPGVEPDAPIGTVTNALKTAILSVCHVSEHDHPRPFACGVLLQSQTCVASNGFVIIESWHGIDLPNLLVPKQAIEAVAKSEKTLKAFGFSETSITFYFEDDSFIKSPLFENTFPKYQHLLNVESNAWPLPIGFFDAVDTVAPFADSSIVYFIDGKVKTALNDEGASFSIEGIKSRMAFNLKYLNLIRPVCKEIHFMNNTEKNMSLFFGENLRGAIVGIALK